MRKSPRALMLGAHYTIVANIINKIQDLDERKRVADHFATEFRKRFKHFDPITFERACGGQIRGFDINTGKWDDGTPLN